jgi:hypothetical protein
MSRKPCGFTSAQARKALAHASIRTAGSVAEVASQAVSTASAKAVQTSLMSVVTKSSRVGK